MTPEERCLTCTLPSEACDNGCKIVSEPARGTEEASSVNFDSWLVPDGPDGTHPLDHQWLTARWTVDMKPPVVRLVRYTRDGWAVISGVKPEGGLFTKTVKADNLKWCGGLSVSRP